MKFLVDKKERYCVIEPLEDKITGVISPELKTEFVLLRKEGYRNIICDLKNVSYVDSSGLSALLIAHRICVEDGNGQFVMTNLNDSIEKLITLSQLDQILTTIPTTTEAADYVLLQELERDLKGE